VKNYDSDIEKKTESAWKADYGELPKTEIKHSWREFKDRIANGRDRKKSKFYFRISGVAALLAVILTGYFFQEIYNPRIQIANYSPGDKEITLPDGSIVLLKENSVIKKDFRMFEEWN